ncbi:hypothetical protein A3A76_02505 [Candidatus Woesebacteria bacterium RIFCSPLOWO2_01_FULL_39_23]|uniref:DNA polymerase III subunit delta n=1 Tax=Candidatus Woesebacteria bacterium RIFCSPHIGHO2_01_FULL_40_22 TaxID=1802499 RepID=A0A1F7YJA3_9BACT|nr:MAG: hypothetical protein A2141_01525 [Candidatus Woesebacteria bacterium RBG_16_40_11]OGM27347.1 MAG: hypothetical protein A2628_00910 [Candidatus Woesebacteria bacterium RIFCSPHIGHO2_01_FULL_40_22]OGM36956.1 MAG: hypothetical protein A3E41_05780 [Candidatus Woesebacteria bacterium RIFCSPHIGHO2_12_FULL_38_9]OGM62519.1 MAG: hypothetical protein A3A76_02505 [Candidatus Woesebacteria bacterium RIFCSPLOWO2_01_FULL_39_23]
MHAFLITGHDPALTEKEIDKLLKTQKARRMDVIINKIADVRDLEKITKLAQVNKLAITVKNIDKAGSDALNAFLKPLEEPQTNIIYILTATIPGTIPETIISRCQLIRTREESINPDTIAFTENFLNMSVGQKLELTTQIKDREQALNFSENLISGIHKLIMNSQGDIYHLSNVLQEAEALRHNIIANGNITLQITNFIVNSSSWDETGN